CDLWPRGGHPRRQHLAGEREQAALAAGNVPLVPKAVIAFAYSAQSAIAANKTSGLPEAGSNSPCRLPRCSRVLIYHSSAPSIRRTDVTEHFAGVARITPP